MNFHRIWTSGGIVKVEECKFEHFSNNWRLQELVVNYYYQKCKVNFLYKSYQLTRYPCTHDQTWQAIWHDDCGAGLKTNKPGWSPFSVGFMHDVYVSRVKTMSEVTSKYCFLSLPLNLIPVHFLYCLSLFCFVNAGEWGMICLL